MWSNALNLTLIKHVLYITTKISKGDVFPGSQVIFLSGQFNAKDSPNHLHLLEGNPPPPKVEVGKVADKPKQTPNSTELCCADTEFNTIDN